MSGFPTVMKHVITSSDSASGNLIVTDSQSTALAIQQSLKRLGYERQDDHFVTIDQSLSFVHSYSSTLERILFAIGSDIGHGLGVIRQICELATVPVYFIGPRDAGLILDAIHAGAADFIEDSELLEQNLAQALSRVKTFGKGNRDNGQLICIKSARGGCGGSVTSANLTVAFAQQWKRAVLCDFDVRNGVCDALLNLKPKHSLIDLERCLENLDCNSVELALARHHSGAHLLPASLRSLDEQLPTSELTQRVLRTLRQMFPVVVVDLPQFVEPIDPAPILSTCDKLIIVTQMDFNSIRSTKRELYQLERSGLTAQRTYVVGNRQGQSSTLSLTEGEMALGRKVNHLLPDDPKAVNLSINCGIPYVISSPNSRISKSIQFLAESLTDDSKLQASTANDSSENQKSKNELKSRVHWSKWLGRAWTGTAQ